METTILAALGILGLFLALSKTADVLVLHVRSLGKELGIPLMALGVLLGLCTTAPELAIGISAMAEDASAISFGNITGGIFVLLGLVMGISVLWRGGVPTKQYGSRLLWVLPYLVLPIVLGFDGQINKAEGIVLIVAYVALTAYLLARHRKETRLRRFFGRPAKPLLHLTWVIGCVGVLFILSNLLVDLTLYLFAGTGVSMFAVGLLVYSVGTNLPEIMIAVRSFKRSAHDLSFSNLLGAAAAHPMIIGVLAMLRPITIEVDVSYIVLFIGTVILALYLGISWKTDHHISMFEGLVLILGYSLFVAIQVMLFVPVFVG